jgi:hypothetical protein
VPPLSAARGAILFFLFEKSGWGEVKIILNVFNFIA